MEPWKLRELPETGLSSWISPMALQVQPWLRGDGLTHLEGEKPKGFQSKLVVTHTRNIFPQQTKLKKPIFARMKVSNSQQLSLFFVSLVHGGFSQLITM